MERASTKNQRTALRLALASLLLFGNLFDFVSAGGYGGYGGSFSDASASSSASASAGSFAAGNPWQGGVQQTSGSYEKPKNFAQNPFLAGAGKGGYGDTSSGPGLTGVQEGGVSGCKTGRCGSGGTAPTGSIPRPGPSLNNNYANPGYGSSGAFAGASASANAFSGTTGGFGTGYGRNKNCGGPGCSNGAGSPPSHPTPPHSPICNGPACGDTIHNRKPIRPVSPGRPQPYSPKEEGHHYSPKPKQPVPCTSPACSDAHNPDSTYIPPKQFTPNNEPWHPAISPQGSSKGVPRNWNPVIYPNPACTGPNCGGQKNTNKGCTGPSCGGAPNFNGPSDYKPSGCTGPSCGEPKPACSGPNCRRTQLPKVGCPGPYCGTNIYSSTGCPGPYCDSPEYAQPPCTGGPNCKRTQLPKVGCPGPNCGKDIFSTTGCPGPYCNSPEYAQPGCSGSNCGNKHPTNAGESPCFGPHCKGNDQPYSGYPNDGYDKGCSGPECSGGEEHPKQPQAYRPTNTRCSKGNCQPQHPQSNSKVPLGHPNKNPAWPSFQKPNPDLTKGIQQNGHDGGNKKGCTSGTCNGNYGGHDGANEKGCTTGTCNGNKGYDSGASAGAFSSASATSSSFAGNNDAGYGGGQGNSGGFANSFASASASSSASAYSGDGYGR